MLDGLGDLRHHRVRSDGDGADADGRGESALVDVPRARTDGGLGSGHEEQRDPRLRRLGECGQRVGEARTVRRRGRRDPAARTEVGVRGDDGARLMAE